MAEDDACNHQLGARAASAAAATTYDAVGNTSRKSGVARASGHPPSSVWHWLTEEKDPQRRAGSSLCRHCNKPAKHGQHAPEDARRHLRNCRPFIEMMEKMPEDRRPEWYAKPSRPLCTFPGCTTFSHRGQRCGRHGEKRYCAVPGCNRVANGLKCSGHQSSVPRPPARCKWKGGGGDCTNLAKIRGHCQRHSKRVARLELARKLQDQALD